MLHPLPSLVHISWVCDRVKVVRWPCSARCPRFNAPWGGAIASTTTGPLRSKLDKGYSQVRTVLGLTVTIVTANPGVTSFPPSRFRPLALPQPF